VEIDGGEVVGAVSGTGIQVENGLRILRVAGTDGKDHIQIFRDGDRYKVMSHLNLGGDDTKRTFHVSDVDQFRILLYAGDDHVHIQKDVLIGAIIDGGDGNDHIETGGGDDLVRGGAGNDQILTGAGHDIALGGDGDDLIKAGDGRDIVIGGHGRDNLHGDSGDDILIGGFTSHDDNDTALLAMLAEWISSERDYSMRVANIQGIGSGSRLNGNYFFNASTVFDDQDRDHLFGKKGRDWFFANLGEDEAKREKDEQLFNL
jgi:Ca2+-binding RTX toxin-like protein